jgi:hypothetical protein
LTFKMPQKRAGKLPCKPPQGRKPRGRAASQASQGSAARLLSCSGRRSPTRSRSRSPVPSLRRSAVSSVRQPPYSPLTMMSRSRCTRSRSTSPPPAEEVEGTPLTILQEIKTRMALALSFEHHLSMKIIFRTLFKHA